MESWSRLAESLLRNGPGEEARWEGATLRSSFQPIFDARRAKCVGYEALARVDDAGGSRMRTEAFFAAQANGHVILADRVCRALHLRSFASRDPGEGRLFVNVRPEAALADARSPGDFADLIRYYGLEPRRVCVEVVESHCDDEGLLREAVGAYRRMGAGIAIDDFGTGRSNFDRIATLRPDVVKLDRSILADVAGRAKAHHMLAPIVRLLHQAGAQVAVEGIETVQEAMVAIDSGADLLQGNYFAAPAAALADHRYAAGVLHRLWGMREIEALAGDAR